MKRIGTQKAKYLISRTITPEQSSLACAAVARATLNEVFGNTFQSLKEVKCSAITRADGSDARPGTRVDIPCHEEKSAQKDILERPVALYALVEGMQDDQVVMHTKWCMSPSYPVQVRDKIVATWRPILGLRIICIPVVGDVVIRVGEVLTSS